MRVGCSNPACSARSHPVLRSTPDRSPSRNAPAVSRTSRRPKTGPIRLFSPESSLSQADNAPDHRATLIASALRFAPAHHHQLRNATVVLSVRMRDLLGGFDDQEGFGSDAWV